MASCAHGILTTPTSTGDQVVTGLGFQPKLIFFYGVLRTATGWGTTGGASFVLQGVWVDADAGSSRLRTSYIAMDNVTPSDTSGESSVTAAIQYLTDATPTVGGAADVSATGSDGFTLTWSSAPAAGYKLYWFAVGGSDLLHLYKALLAVDAAAGTQASVAPNFPPDVLITAYNLWQGGGGWGWASREPAGQGVAYSLDRDARNPSESAQAFSGSDVLGGYRLAGAPIVIQQDMLASLDSFDALGYTLNKSDPPAAVRQVHVMAVQGGGWSAGVETVPASTGLQLLPNTALAAGVMLLSACGAAGGTSGDVKVGFGCAAGSSQAAVFMGSEDAAAPTVTDQFCSETACLVAGADIGTQTIESIASLHSFAPEGIYLDWTTVSGAGEPFTYLAVGASEEILRLLPILGVGI